MSARGRLELAGAAVLFSTGGAAIKAASLGAWAVASFRSGVAVVALVLLVPEARRVPGPRHLLVGVAYAATLTLFVIANKLTTSANTIFLQSTAPLYLLVLGPLLLGEQGDRRDLPTLAALALGMALIVGGGETAVRTAPDPVRGNLLAAASGVAWAITIAGLRWLGRAGESGLGAVVAGNVLACAVGLPLALPAEGRAIDWVVIAYLGTVQIGLAYVLVTRALRTVRALEASLLLLIEPALNPLWAWAVHGERPGPWSLAGGALILAATGVQGVRGALRSEAA